VIAIGWLVLTGSPSEGSEWWELPTAVLLLLCFSVALGFPIACAVGVPVSAWLRRLGYVRAHHYVLAGAAVSVAVYASYLCYRWWWQVDDPMFPSLPTAIRQTGWPSIARFEFVAAICILSLGPFSAWCYWKGERHAA
jgi:hypothetical protein